MSAAKPNPPFYTRLAMILISLLALFYIAILGREILAPLIFSLLFSVLLLPFAGWLEKRMHFPRSLASIVSVLTLLLCVAGLLYLIGSQVSMLAKDWPQFKQQLSASVSSFQNWISAKFHVDLEDQQNYVENATTKILNTGPSVIGTTIASVSSVLLFIVFTLVDTFFLLYYRRLIIRFLVSVFKEDNSLAVYDIIAKIQSRIRQYVLGLLLEMAVVSTVGCVALLIIGVKYALLLGLLTGLLNLIPYIGIFISLLLSVLVTFAAAGTAKILLVMAVLFAIHLLDSNFLLPMIVGSKVRVNALITILGVIIGETVWGVIGAFLALPLIAITKIIFDRIDPLKPWGMLLGDEHDEKEPEPLKEEIEEKQEGEPPGNAAPEVVSHGRERAKKPSRKKG